MFKFNKLYLTTSIIFAIGLICIFFNSLSDYLNWAALAILSIGFVLLAVCFLKNYSSFKKQLQNVNEEIVMEKGETFVEDGVEYVYVQNSNYQQKMKKEIKATAFKKILPVAISFLMSAIMITLLILQII